MRIDEKLQALRGNRALQRQIQQRMDQALERWRGDPEVAPLLAQLDEYGAGASLDSLPALALALRSPDAARHLADGWCAAMVPELRREPLAQIPFRHSGADGFTASQLASSGGASLSLLAYEERAAAGEPASASFVDCDQHEIVLSGRARGWHHRIIAEGTGGQRIVSSGASWRPGDCIAIEGGDQTRQIIAVDGHCCLLRLVRVMPDPAPTRELALADGRLLHLACGDKAVSQAEMALAVLGALGRRDAVPAITALAHAGPAHLRWEAARHALALDPLAGMDLLGDLAEAHGDELAPSARALRAQLVTRYPQLTQ